jgi:hypothetical protein
MTDLEKESVSKQMTQLDSHVSIEISAEFNNVKIDKRGGGAQSR